MNHHDDHDRPRLSICHSQLTDAELLMLIQWSAEQQYKGQFQAFADWLWAVANEELDRRYQPGAEPGMLPSPTWDFRILADGLVAVHVLERLALTDSLSEFMDELAMHIAAAASSILMELAESGARVQ
jgi:hypothetical protein